MSGVAWLSTTPEGKSLPPGIGVRIAYEGVDYYTDRQFETIIEGSGRMEIHCVPPDRRAGPCCDLCGRFDVRERVAHSIEEMLEYWCVTVDKYDEWVAERMAT